MSGSTKVHYFSSCCLSRAFETKSSAPGDCIHFLIMSQIGRTWASYCRVGERCMPAPGDAGEEGAFDFGLAADGDGMVKNPALFEEVKEPLRFFAGEVKSLFLHYLHHSGMDSLSRFQSGAFHKETFTAKPA